MRLFLTLMMFTFTAGAQADLAIEFTYTATKGGTTYTQLELYKKDRFCVSLTKTDGSTHQKHVVRFDKKLVWNFIPDSGGADESTHEQVDAKFAAIHGKLGAQPAVTVKKVGEGKVAGYDCAKYEISAGGVVYFTVWATEKLSYGMDARRAWTLAGMAGNGKLPTEVAGVILKLTDKRGTIEAKKVSKKGLAVKLFEKPTD